MVDFDRSAFIGKFQEEAADLLQRLNEDVITLEARPDDRALIDEMLRDAHTLKGASRMVGLMDVSNIAHRLEDIMIQVRDHRLRFTAEMSDGFFEGLDAIMFLVERGAEDSDAIIDLDSLQARLASFASNGEGPCGPSAEDQGAGQGRVEPTVIIDSAGGASRGTEGAVAPDPGKTASAALGADDSVEAPGEGVQLADARARVRSTIRVRSEQVDRLLNVISEVVITQIKSEQRLTEIRTLQEQIAQLNAAVGRLKPALRDDSLSAAGRIPVHAEITFLDALASDMKTRCASLLKAYGDDVSRAGVVIGELQEQAMTLRMLPADTIFQAFPRAVRDLSRQFRKDIELIIEGGETELDKKVLEEINDPLIHIIRNAVDHGIEDAATRLERGKPEKGRIELSARQEGDRIVIEISDDGGGIDPGKVRAIAVRKGYLTEAEARALSDREATYLIFEPGFSTAAIITEISGRGVGMDVVREFVVEKLKGSIDVSSELGSGTTFRLTLPLTLAIIRALLLRVGGQVFALPTASIEETLRVDPHEIIKAEGREVVRRQRRTIPVVPLGDILGMDHAESDAEAGGKVFIVTIGFSGQRTGFMVDGFLGEQQIVIKPLGEHLNRVENIAGLTVLGAGEVVPILNVPDLMSNARLRSGSRVGPLPKEVHEGALRVLICEDSFTTRELERSIFEAAGYEVETAVDGEEGIQMLRGGARVDAVVTDVQMPRMSGFDMTRAIKRDANLKSIPVVIVTSLERDEEKAEGIEAGADAYITKSVFNQDTLLDTVERLIR